MRTLRMKRDLNNLKEMRENGVANELEEFIENRDEYKRVRKYVEVDKNKVKVESYTLKNTQQETEYINETEDNLVSSVNIILFVHEFITVFEPTVNFLNAMNEQLEEYKVYKTVTHKIDDVDFKEVFIKFDDAVSYLESKIDSRIASFEKRFKGGE